MNWVLFQNSLWVAGGTAAAATAAAFVAAIAAFCWGAGARTGLACVAGLSLALPPFLLVNAWLNYFGMAGEWRAFLPFDIYSMGGVIWILSLWLWPIPFFFLWAAWRRIEAEHLESDPMLGGWPLVRRVLLPSGRRQLGQGAIVVFVLALNNFSVPSILQARVFPAEVWLRLNTTLDYGAAALHSLPLVAAPLFLVAWLQREGLDWPARSGPAPTALVRRRLGGAWARGCGAATVLLAAISLGFPLFQLLSSETAWSEFGAAVRAGQRAAFYSVGISAAAGVLTLLASWGIWRVRPAFFLWALFLIPGVLLGAGLVLLTNRPWLAPLGQSAGVMIAALTLRHLAVGWQGVRNARGSVDRDHRDWARLSGASGGQMFLRVEWPQVSRQLMAAWYVVYLLCLWDVESLIMVVPPGAETLSIRIFNLLHYGHNSQVDALCLVVLLLALLPPLVWFAVSVGKRWAAPGLRLGAVSAIAFLAVVGCRPTPIATEGRTPVQSRFFSGVEIIGARGVAPGQFNKPRSVAVDREDCLYAVDMTGRVQKFAAEGRYLTAWQMPETDKGRPKGMGVDAEGNIIVIEPHYSRINHFSPEGQLVAQWGTHGKGKGELMFPRSVAVAADGDLYVSEYGAVERIQWFESRGAGWIGAFGEKGSAQGQLNRAEGLAIDAEGRLRVADSCNHRIQVFDAEGDFLRAYGRAGAGLGELSYPYDVLVDASGYQYVCEFGNSRVQIFDPDDRPVEIVGGPGAGPGEFSNPWAMAFDSRGNLYVADGGNHRVQKFLRKDPWVSGRAAAGDEGGEASERERGTPNL